MLVLRDLYSVFILFLSYTIIKEHITFIYHVKNIHNIIDY